MKKLLEYLRGSASNLLFQATGGFTSLSHIDTQGGQKLTGLFSGGTNLAGFFNKLFLFAISVGAIIAVVQLVIAGYYYMFSETNWTSKEKAKEKFRNVVTGLLLLLSIWLILYKINPDMVNLSVLTSVEKYDPTSSLTPPPYTPPASGPCPPGPPGSGGGYRIPDTGVCIY